MALCDESATNLARKLRRGDISSRELTESVLARIEERDEVTNAFITVTRDEALKAADRADERFRSAKATPPPPLNGLPVALKDNLCTQGVRTTCAARIL